MREIKFRALDYDGNWQYASGNDELYQFFYALDDGQLKGDTRSQYTGLKDKNGKEIYEGDIVEYEDFSNGFVIFGGNQPLRKEVIEWKFKHNGYQLQGHGFTFKGEDCEVIGSIHENPELLK